MHGGDIEKEEEEESLYIPRPMIEVCLIHTWCFSIHGWNVLWAFTTILKPMGRILYATN